MMVIQLPGTTRLSPPEQAERISTLPSWLLRKLEWLAANHPGMLEIFETTIDDLRGRAHQ